MRLALFLPPQQNEMWRLAVQLGVTQARLERISYDYRQTIS
jgi:hypothetical protein